jgi:pimeloyl-ACP methyl ester carboxylesterase
MPFLERYGASIYYEEFGSGYPVMLFAPGSFQAAIDWWHKEDPAFDPTVFLANDFRLIAMDQRNAGQSRALITPQDGWHNFTEDHVALLDYLDIERAHVLGACIGVSHALRLSQVQPWRVSAAVLQQPIGTLKEKPSPSGGFNGWRESLKDHPEASEAVLDAYAGNLYAQNFVYNVSRDFVRQCQTPLLVLPGNDQAHPYEIADEIAHLAPNVEFIADWKEPAVRPSAMSRVVEFLRSHTPADASSPSPLPLRGRG